MAGNRSRSELAVSISPEPVVPLVEPVEVEPYFRAITDKNGERRGIRLEKLYWDSLNRMSASTQTSTSDLVGYTAASSSKDQNLASVLRVLSLKWALNRVDAMEDISSMANLNALVQASPSPTLVLTLDKKIQLFNEPFLALLRNRLLLNDPAQLAKSLRLTIDTPVDDAMDTLSRQRGKTLTTGFSLALGSHNLKGQINLALAPAHEKPMLIGYVARL